MIGSLIQTISHIVEECQRTRYEGEVAALHDCDQMVNGTCYMILTIKLENHILCY